MCWECRHCSVKLNCAHLPLALLSFSSVPVSHDLCVLQKGPFHHHRVHLQEFFHCAVSLRIQKKHKAHTFLISRLSVALVLPLQVSGKHNGGR